MNNEQNLNMVNETKSQVITNENRFENKPSKKNNKKIKLIIITSIILVVLGIIIFIVLKSNKKGSVDQSLNAIFDPNKPIMIEKNNKYGYITSDGKEMIEPKYEDVSSFYGDYAIVKVKSTDSKSSKDSFYQIIDKKGNVKIEKISSRPKYYAEYSVWLIDGSLYDSKLNSISDKNSSIDYIANGYFAFEDKKENKSGIIDSKGKEIFSFEGSYIYADMESTSFTEDDYYMRVTSHDKDLVLSLKAKKVVYTVENTDKYHLSIEDDNIFEVYDSKTYNKVKSLYFQDGKKVYETDSDVYELSVYDYENKILKIDYGYSYETKGKKSRYAYYDLKSKKILDRAPSVTKEKEDEISFKELTYGYKEYSCSSKEGLMKDNEVVIPCEYDEVEFLEVPLYKYISSLNSQKLVLLEKDDKTILMDLNNKKTITTFDSKYITDSDSTTFLKIYEYDKNSYTKKNQTVYNLITGKSMTFKSNEDVKIYSNYIIVKKNNQKIYYNTKLEKIYVQK